MEINITKRREFTKNVPHAVREEVRRNHGRDARATLYRYYLIE
jgi:hypothetical protein